jgi:hypothetical protein
LNGIIHHIIGKLISCTGVNNKESQHPVLSALINYVSQIQFPEQESVNGCWPDSKLGIEILKFLATK